MSSVSVIVPTYNCARFIGEAIDSILGQTKLPDQIIVVDDGSTDDTEQVVRRYGARVEYIKQKNTGVSAARNTGLDAARCDFVSFLDADDRWRPTYIQTMREFLIANRRAVCAFANFVRFEHTTGDVLGDQFQYYPSLHSPELTDDLPSIAIRHIPKSFAFSVLVGFGEVPAFTQVMMFRRDRIQDLRFDPSLRVCEDMHFALRAFMRGDVCFTSEILAEVRRHDSNATIAYQAIALHKLIALNALAPFVSGQDNLAAYHDRLVKAHIDAALTQARMGHFRAGWKDLWDGMRVPGSSMRKVKGSIRLALAACHLA